MACDYPNSHFTGHDIKEVFPGPEAELPTNCTFLKADTLSLPFEDGTFDYVFQRYVRVMSIFLVIFFSVLKGTCLMYSCRLLGTFFTLEEWATAIQELVRVTKPGGWIELVEFNLIYNRQGPNYQDFQNTRKHSPMFSFG